MSEAVWEERQLGELATFEYGASLPSAARTGDEHPVFGSSGEVGRHAAALVRGPGIVVGRKGTVGALTWSDEEFWPIDTTYYIKAIAGVNLRWLYWAMSRLGLRLLDSSTGVPGLNRNDAYERPVSVPSEGEQQCIVEILDSLDHQISTSRKIVGKLTSTQWGLLESTFARLAIPGQATIDLPISSVLSHLIDFRGRTPKKLGLDWGGGQILALSANNVQMGLIDRSKEAYYGSDRLYRAWMTNGAPRRGDVLITLEAPLGNVAQVTDEARYILSQRVVLLRFDEARVLNDYAYWALRSAQFQRSLVRKSTGTTASGIRRAELERLTFPVPRLQDQKEIVAQLSALQNSIDTERARLSKLRSLDAGLKADLLSGHVRIQRGSMS